MAQRLREVTWFTQATQLMNEGVRPWNLDLRCSHTPPTGVQEMQVPEEEAGREGAGSGAPESSFTLWLFLVCSLLSLIELTPGAPALFNEAATHLKKLELDTVKAPGPWPALHININKVPRTRTRRWAWTWSSHQTSGHEPGLPHEPVPLAWRGLSSGFSGVSAQCVCRANLLLHSLLGWLTDWGIALSAEASRLDLLVVSPSF